MKKLFILISFIFVSICVNAQNTDVDVTLDYGNYTYVWYNGIATDVLTTTDTTWSYTVRKKTGDMLRCYVDLLIDSTGGTANNVNIYLQNKKFPDLDYTTITTVLWDGTNGTSLGELVAFAPSSEILTFNSDSTTTRTESDQFNAGEYWRVLIVGADNTLLASIRRLNLKFIKP